MAEAADIQKTMCDILGVEPGEKFGYINAEGKIETRDGENPQLYCVHSSGQVATPDFYEPNSLNADILWDLINHPQLIVRADGSHPSVPEYKFDENFLPIPRVCELLGVKPDEDFSVNYKEIKFSRYVQINHMGHHNAFPSGQMIELFDRTVCTVSPLPPEKEVQGPFLDEFEYYDRAYKLSPQCKFDRKLSAEYAEIEHCRNESLRGTYSKTIEYWLKDAARENKLLTPMQVGILIRTPHLFVKMAQKLGSEDWQYKGCDTRLLESCTNKIICENATPKEREQLMTEAKVEINEYVKANAGNIKGQHIMALMNETDSPNWDDIFAVRQEIHQLDRCRFTERELHLDREQPNKNGMAR